jgi:hypothetical protein
MPEHTQGFAAQSQAGDGEGSAWFRECSCLGATVKARCSETDGAGALTGAAEPVPAAPGEDGRPPSSGVALDARTLARGGGSLGVAGDRAHAASVTSVETSTAVASRSARADIHVERSARV